MEMVKTMANRFARPPDGTLPKCYLLSAALLLTLAAGCHHAPLLDATPLDSAGMSYDSIKTAKTLSITAPEVAELAKVRRAGLSDAVCITLLQIFHARKQPFASGNAIAGLVEVHMSDDTIIELARLNQVGIGSGDLQAMRLAGISDATILEVARHRSEGKAVLAGASLANMKNAGIRDSTLQELVRRGIPDSQIDSILAMRRRGGSDAEILRYFAGS
jgi:hypothetical protein